MSPAPREDWGGDVRPRSCPWARTTASVAENTEFARHESARSYPRQGTCSRHHADVAFIEYGLTYGVLSLRPRSNQVLERSPEIGDGGIKRVGLNRGAARKPRGQGAWVGGASLTSRSVFPDPGVWRIGPDLPASTIELLNPQCAEIHTI